MSSHEDTLFFFEICQLFEKLELITHSATSKRATISNDTGSSYYLTKTLKTQVYKILSDWFSKLKAFNLLHIFRLLVPEEDVCRVYYIKEKRLAQLLVHVLGLDGSSRASNLLKWTESCDLSSTIYDLISTSEHVLVPSLSVSRLDSLLNNLAELGISSQGKDIDKMKKGLSEIYLSMTSIESKWITRIILKNLRITIEPKLFFDTFHKWMWKVYSMKNDLKKTCETITELIKEGHHNPNINNSESFASVAQKYFQPELGTSIAIMECGRGKGIDQVAEKMKGKVSYIETKFDGERLQAHFNSSWPDPLKFFSKSGRNSSFNRRLCHQQVLDAIDPSKVSNCILEGELLVYNEINNTIEPFGTVQDLGRKEFKEKGILLGRRHFLIYFFDLIFLNGECLMRKPLNERRRLLSLIIREIPNYVYLSPVTVLDFRQTSNFSSTMEVFRQLYLECLDRREEGLIIKNADSFYVPGDRNNWWKLKKDYIEGFGDSADLAIIGATKSRSSNGLMDTFIAACLTNKSDLDNDPLSVPSFQAIFTVSLGVTKAELDLLQAILEARKELNSHDLPYDFQVAKGFKIDDFGCCWLKEPLVFELLGSGFVRERGMWCYSLRFPRIRRIKMNQSFMDCITFQELQEMGRDSMSPSVPNKIPETPIDESYSNKPQKRVRFVIDEAEIKRDKLLKRDFFVHLSKKIKLKDRDRLSNWLEYLGFELIWSFEAAIQFSDRKLIVVKDEGEDLARNEKVAIVIPWDKIENYLKIENSYFYLNNF